jgi:predicted amidohydrolase
MNALRVSIVQSEIAWEDKAQNLQHFGNLLSDLKGKSDLAVFPEMFTTGFSMNAPELAENNAGNTVKNLQAWAKEYQFAITGSFLAKNDDGKLFNRGFFITPEGVTTFADKRHLFRMGGEEQVFSSTDSYPILSYHGWNIRLIVCYDLRFPVWMRNKDNEYDLLICVANFPASRAKVWDILLKARAIENQCYVCGVNRIGTDCTGLAHQGDSMVIDYKGEPILKASNQASILTATIEKEKLTAFRTKFPVWKDADSFEINF